MTWGCRPRYIMANRATKTRNFAMSYATHDQSAMHYKISWDGVTLAYWSGGALVQRDMAFVDANDRNARFYMELYRLPDMIDDFTHYMLRLTDKTDDKGSADLVLMEPVEHDRLAEFADECRAYGMKLDLALVRDVTQKTPGLN
jgi:hypothetical protein